MVTPEDVKSYIERGLPCEHLELAGDGQHFQALIVSAEFRGKSRVQRHQRVYQALGERMREEVHALSMQTLTPEEWHEQGAGAAEGRKRGPGASRGSDPGGGR